MQADSFKKSPSAAAEKRLRQEQELDELMGWVTNHLEAMTAVPRVDDVVRYAYTQLGFRNLTRSAIAKRLRLHPAYLMNSTQTRGKKRWKKYRRILSNTLGMLHGDIGFFAVKRGYETPKTFRSGFLVLKDVLSRYTYATILQGSRTAESMVRAFQNVLEQHGKRFNHRIKSIAFDQERSVMSNIVQNFFRDNSIAFHPFKFTASKSKFAEGAIKLIRVQMARLTADHPKRMWWRTLANVVNILNEQPIRISGRVLRRPAAGREEVWRPVDVDADSLDEFLEDLLKADPMRRFSQSEISPQLVKFKYPVGTVVRPKLLITSSAVIGEKRSEVNLEQDPFVVTQQLAYVNARNEVGRTYRCVNQRTRETEIFDENDLAESKIYDR